MVTIAFCPAGDTGQSAKRCAAANLAFAYNGCGTPHSTLFSPGRPTGNRESGGADQRYKPDQPEAEAKRQRQIARLVSSTTAVVIVRV
jgi:hypothetical protein